MQILRILRRHKTGLSTELIKKIELDRVVRVVKSTKHHRAFELTYTEKPYSQDRDRREDMTTIFQVESKEKVKTWINCIRNAVEISTGDYRTWLGVTR